MSHAIAKGKSQSNNSSPTKQKTASRPDRQLPLVVLLRGAVLSCIGPNVGEKRWEQVRLPILAYLGDELLASTQSLRPAAYVPS